jgi:kynureninase
MKNTFSIAKNYAVELDLDDELKIYKDFFLFPKKKSVKYFCGHSLGLQPKNTKNQLLQHLHDWEDYAVEGHWKAKQPWISIHKSFQKTLSKITGSYPNEVVAMNSLTVNLHLMFATFYKPKGKKTKILCEAINFSSDRFALESLVKSVNKPMTTLVTIAPLKTKSYTTTEQWIAYIEKHHTQLAMVFLNGINYYNGQSLDIEKIARTARRYQIIVGLDLAHAIGNIDLNLHDWGIDFAVWCSYKYLSGGPGAVGGAFIHQKHGLNPKTPRLSGWWGHEEKSRFDLKGSFKAIKGAEGFQLSNAPVFNMQGLYASLEMYEKVDWKLFQEKRAKSFDYFMFLLKAFSVPSSDKKFTLTIITPIEEGMHGSMISLQIKERNGKSLFETLFNKGYWIDWRSPNVIRISFHPFYTSYKDIFSLAYELGKLSILK